MNLPTPFLLSHPCPLPPWLYHHRHSPTPRLGDILNLPLRSILLYIPLHQPNQPPSHAGAPGDTSLSDRVFLRLLVIDQDLAFAAETARFLMRDAHEGKARMAFAEYCVHLLEAAARRFGIEEVDDRDNEGVSALKAGRRRS